MEQLAARLAQRIIMTPQSIGGRVTAERSRREAIRKYMENPNICKLCNNPILVHNNERVSTVKRKQFCNNTCSARYSNTRRSIPTIERNFICEDCGSKIVPKKGRSHPYQKIRYCKACLRTRQAKRASLTFHGIVDYVPTEVLSKKQLKDKRNGYQSFRSNIRKMAYLVYKDIFGSGVICENCSYDKQADIAHVKAVSEHPDTALLTEINSIDNLIALCKRCHWEYDNGHITREHIESIIKRRVHK